MRILVIDDDGLAAAITAALLEEIEHDPLIAESVAEARISLVEYPDIATIICDLQMPDTDGLSFFSELRQTGSTLPFILLTGTQMSLASDGGKSAVTQAASAPDWCLLKDETLEAKLGRVIAQILARDTL